MGLAVPRPPGTSGVPRQRSTDTGVPGQAVTVSGAVETARVPESGFDRPTRVTVARLSGGTSETGRRPEERWRVRFLVTPGFPRLEQVTILLVRGRV